MLIKLNPNPTSEDLQNQHKLYISGSQVHEILNRPWDNLRSAMGQEKLDDPYKYINTGDSPNYHTMIGTFMEDKILDLARTMNPEIFQYAQTDKASYQLKGTPFSFNIDAFLGTDINNVEAVIEIKCTSEKDLSCAKERGWIDQMKFYCLCLGIHKAYLIGLCASKYKVMEFAFSQKELDELRYKLLDYDKLKQQAILNNDPFALDSLREEANPQEELEITDPAQIIRLDEIMTKQELIKAYEKDVKNFKTDMKTIYSDKHIVWKSNNIDYEIKHHHSNRSNTDWSGVVQDLMNTYDIANDETFRQLVERNTKSIQTITTYIRKVK